MGCCEGQQFDKLVLIALEAPFEDIGGIARTVIAKAVCQFGKARNGEIVLCLHAGFDRLTGQEDIEIGMIARIRQYRLHRRACTTLASAT